MLSFLLLLYEAGSGLNTFIEWEVEKDNHMEERLKRERAALRAG